MIDYFKALQQDKDDAEFFEQIIVDNLEIWQRLWRIGDGDGGGVIDAMREMLSYPVRDQPSRNKKQKISSSLRIRVFERDRYRCKLCNSHIDLTVDHIIPESRGGSLDFCNLQTLYHSCNSKKGIK